MDTASDTSPTKNNNHFTILQSNRTITDCNMKIPSLCPSMDLLSVIQTPKQQPRNGSSIWIYRSMSWQRLFPITSNDSTICNTCWSPNGRYIAVGFENGHVHVYYIEDGGGGTTAIHPSYALPKYESKEEEEDMAVGFRGAMSPVVTRSVALRRKKEAEMAASSVISGLRDADKTRRGEGGDEVVGLTWGKMCNPTDDENVIFGDGYRDEDEDYEDDLEEELVWRLQSHYLDRLQHFIPPKNHSNSSEHHTNTNNNDENDDTARVLLQDAITSQTDLTVLCTVTKSSDIYLYLHGRYLISTIAPPPTTCLSSSSTQIVITSDLTTLCTCQNDAKSHFSLLSLHTIPHLYTHRHDLQHLSSCYITYTQQVDVITNALSQAYTTWADAIRPLETKLLSLMDLFKKYGFSNPIHLRTEFLLFLLTGGNTSSTDSHPRNSVFHQFLSNTLHHPSTFQRMGKSLLQETETFEKMIRQSILHPSIQFVYIASELLSRSSSSFMFLSTTSSTTAMSEFYHSTQVLFLSIQTLLRYIIEIRFRIQDFIQWITSLMVNIQFASASGNDDDPQHRRMAKHRKRVPEACLQRIIQFLSSDDDFKGRSNQLQHPLQDLLGIPISMFFTKDEDSLKCDVDMFISAQQQRHHRCPSIETSLEHVKRCARTVFLQPMEYVNQSITSSHFRIHSSSNTESNHVFYATAIHKRRGGTTKLPDKRGAFQPYIAFHTNDMDDRTNTSYSSRYWILYAQTCTTRYPGDDTQRNAIRLMAFPASSTKETTAEGDPNARSNYYLISYLILPESCTYIQDVHFYAAQDDDDEQKQQRQSLAMYMDIAESNDDEDDVSEELWLCSYDNIPFYPVAYDSTECRDEVMDVDASAFEIPELCYSCVLASNDDEEEEEEVDNIIYAKRRQLRVTQRKNSLGIENKSLHYLFTSGSRGVTGVLTDGTLLSLLDMEEDEDMDDDDDEDDTESDLDDDKEDI